MTNRELRAFVTWARARGAVKVQVGEVEVVFSEAQPVQLETPDPMAGLSDEQREVEKKRQKEGLLYGSS